MDGCRNATATLVFSGDTLKFDIAYPGGAVQTRFVAPSFHSIFFRSSGTLEIGGCPGILAFKPADETSYARVTYNRASLSSFHNCLF
jgi:hypothetical protein